MRRLFCGLVWTLLCLPAQAQNESMTLDGPTSQPIGHYEFCQKQKDECGPTQVDEPILLNAQTWGLIVEVNVYVNLSVAPITDAMQWGTDEVWSYPNDQGDCEDYALEKRRMLARLGIPLSGLLITVVRKSDGEGHAVLTVVTSDGNFILDNLTEEVLRWDDTGYTFLKRQASYHAEKWIKILPQDIDRNQVSATDTAP